MHGCLNVFEYLLGYMMEDGREDRKDGGTVMGYMFYMRG